jgi:4-hydroxymandelate oxidase
MQPMPDGVVTLQDHRVRARQALAPDLWAYFCGGAADEITLHGNKTAWDRIELLPRVLRGAAPDLRTSLLGRTMAHPLLLAPVAFQGLAHADGELATGYAAAAQAAGFVLPTQSSVALETIGAALAADGDRGPLWFQLYPQDDPGVTHDLLARVAAAGFEAIVLTVDAPVQGARDRQRRAGFRVPDGAAVNLRPYPGTRAKSQLGWRDVEGVVAATHLPVLLKGVLHPDDARLALASGARGVIVSNHGGRTLDTATATATALPGVVDAVHGQAPVLVDGGIRRGTDILKALALGADAVLVGQPIIWGLATAGAVGVAHVVRLLLDEFAMAMALTGCRRVADAGEVLLQSQAGRPGSA